MNEVGPRRDLVKYSRECITRVYRMQLRQISVRFEDEMLSTPSESNPLDMRHEQVAAVTFDGASPAR